MCSSDLSGQRQQLLDVIAAPTRPTLRLRVRGTSSLLLTPLSQDFFNNRYKAAYPDAEELVFGMAQSYDSTYMVAYAIGQTKPTQTSAVVSLDVARGMSKLSGGTTRIDVGPARIKEGLELARKGEAVDFNGASGPLDFDPGTGDAPGDYAVWCIRLKASDGKPVFENATGLAYRYATDTLDGTFTCE